MVNRVEGRQTEFRWLASIKIAYLGWQWTDFQVFNVNRPLRCNVSGAILRVCADREAYVFPVGFQIQIETAQVAWGGDKRVRAVVDAALAF
jgi:hypothetical protein